MHDLESRLAAILPMVCRTTDMKERPRDWNELERMTGIRRTVPPTVTQNDVTRMTRKRVGVRRWRRRPK